VTDGTGLRARVRPGFGVVDRGGRPRSPGRATSGRRSVAFVPAADTLVVAASTSWSAAALSLCLESRTAAVRYISRASASATLSTRGSTAGFDAQWTRPKHRTTAGSAAQLRDRVFIGRLLLRLRRARFPLRSRRDEPASEGLSGRDGTAARSSVASRAAGWP